MKGIKGIRQNWFREFTDKQLVEITDDGEYLYPESAIENEQSAEFAKFKDMPLMDFTFKAYLTDRRELEQLDDRDLSPVKFRSPHLNIANDIEAITTEFLDELGEEIIYRWRKEHSLIVAREKKIN